jgi:undecaprenyl-diphosphatase
VAASLAVWGVVLFVVDRVCAVQVREVTLTGWKRGLVIGLAQVLSLIPGTSRSGITIAAGRATGLSREVAARFSFLLGIPAILAAGAVSLLDIATGEAVIDTLPVVVGFLTSFVSGLFAIRWLLRLMQMYSYAPFALYRIALAVIVLLVLG